MKKLFAAACLACFALPASAQLSASDLYVGGSLGRSHFTDICIQGVPDCKDRDTAWGAFLGLEFSRYFALEAGYRDLGHAVVGGTSYKANAIEADAVALLPLRGGLGIVGRVGIYNGKLKGGGIEEKRYNPTFGWGVQYDVNPSSGFRVEWQRYAKMGGGDFGRETHADTLSLAALLRFR